MIIGSATELLVGEIHKSDSTYRVTISDDDGNLHEMPVLVLRVSNRTEWIEDFVARTGKPPDIWTLMRSSVDFKFYYEVSID